MLIHHVQGWEFPTQTGMVDYQFIPSTRFRRRKLVSNETISCTLLADGYLDMSSRGGGSGASMNLLGHLRDIVPFQANRRLFMGMKLKMALYASVASIFGAVFSVGAQGITGFTAFSMADFPNYVDGNEYYLELDMDFPNNVVHRRVNGVDLADVVPSAAFMAIISKTHVYNTDTTNVFATWGNSTIIGDNYVGNGTTIHYYFKDLVFYEYEAGDTPAYLGEQIAIPLSVASVDSTAWTASSGTPLAAFNTGYTTAESSSNPLVTTDAAMTPTLLKMALAKAPVGALLGVQLTSMARYSGAVKGDMGASIVANGVESVKRDFPLQAANTVEMPIFSSGKAPDGTPWTKALIEASQVKVTI